MPSETAIMNGITFEVWAKSFRVRAPFVGRTIFVGDNDKEGAMADVADTVNAALAYQHDKTQNRILTAVSHAERQSRP